MFDRWRKLLKAFFNEKKYEFDISKVPDIYDSAKYDAIHNAHLGPPLDEVFDVSPPSHLPKTLDNLEAIHNRCGTMPTWGPPWRRFSTETLLPTFIKP
jgi:hypothetical protein